MTAKRAELFARRLGLAADVVRDHARALENARRETGRRRVPSKTFDADTFAFVSQWPAQRHPGTDASGVLQTRPVDCRNTGPRSPTSTLRCSGSCGCGCSR